MITDGMSTVVWEVTLNITDFYKQPHNTLLITEKWVILSDT